MSIPSIEQVGRKRLVTTGLRMLTATVLLTLIYALAPISGHPHESVIARMTVGLFLFVAVLAWELRAIIAHDFPQLRAISALAVIIPLFLFTFAWIYLTASVSNPDFFNVPLTRVSAFYFTVTVFSTVGFGDISATTDGSQLVVTIQMILDIALLAVGIRAVFGAASVGQKRKASAPGAGDNAAAEPEAGDTRAGGS